MVPSVCSVSGSCLGLVQSHCSCENGCAWSASAGVCWPDKGCQKSQAMVPDWQNQYTVGFAMNPQFCFTSGGGTGQNQVQTCILLQYGTYQDLNGDGLVDIVWQVSDGPNFQYVTLLNNGTTKRFDMTACASSNPSFCPPPGSDFTPELIARAMRLSSKERVVIRFYDDKESAVEITKPFSLEELMDSAAKYLDIKAFSCKITRGGAQITSVEHLYGGDMIDFKCNKM